VKAMNTKGQNLELLFRVSSVFIPTMGVAAFILTGMEEARALELEAGEPFLQRVEVFGVLALIAAWSGIAFAVRAKTKGHHEWANQLIVNIRAWGVMGSFLAGTGWYLMPETSRWEPITIMLLSLSATATYLMGIWKAPDKFTSGTAKLFEKRLKDD
jgi:hypothetical protein